MYAEVLHLAVFPHQIKFNFLLKFTATPLALHMIFIYIQPNEYINLAVEPFDHRTQKREKNLNSSGKPLR